MRKYNFFQCDVFTKTPFGGNPLAVVTDAQDMTALEMGKIAREMNLSETTFVLPPTDPSADFKIRIFTPTTEIPFAGHPTLGTAFVIAEQGFTHVDEPRTQIKLELNIGVIPVTLFIKDNVTEFVQMTQPAPTFGERFNDIATLAKAMAIEESEIRETQLPAEVVSCGLPVLIVPVKSLGAIQNAEPKVELIKDMLKDFESKLLMPFTSETLNAESTIHSRLFAPSFGIIEDPAPGSAGGPIGSYLFKHNLTEVNPTIRIINEIGFEIERPSIINVEIDVQDNGIVGVRVGGCVTMIAEGSLFIKQT